MNYSLYQSPVAVSSNFDDADKLTTKSQNEIKCLVLLHGQNIFCLGQNLNCPRQKMFCPGQKFCPWLKSPFLLMKSL